MAMADTARIIGELSQTHVAPANTVINRPVEHLNRRLSMSRISTPPEILPMVKNRARLSESDSDDPPDKGWLTKKLDGSLIFLSQTGSKMDGQLDLSTLTLLRGVDTL